MLWLLDFRVQNKFNYTKNSKPTFNGFLIGFLNNTSKKLLKLNFKFCICNSLFFHQPTLDRAYCLYNKEKYKWLEIKRQKEKKSYDLLINLGASSFFQHLSFCCFIFFFFSSRRFIVFPFRFTHFSFFSLSFSQIAYKG